MLALSGNEITSSIAAASAKCRATLSDPQRGRENGIKSEIIMIALLVDRYRTYWIVGVFLADACLSVLALWRTPFTDVDWTSYSQQLDLIWGGERNYADIRGDTGPLVYPAGHVLFYSVLRGLTGGKLFQAQAVFCGLYLIQMGMVFYLYFGKEVSLWRGHLFEAVLLVCSRRVHSLFFLRCFNDCVAMTLLYASLCLFSSCRRQAGNLCFGLALSVKMNILMWAPGLLLLPLLDEDRQWRHRFRVWIESGVIILGVNVILALPFLLSHPWAYLQGSFDFSRVFEQRWSVNLQFLPESLFLSRKFHVTLLALHVVLLLIILPNMWKRMTTPQFGVIKRQRLMIKYFFVINFIGVACMRSFHYQFYAWYAATVPYILTRACRASKTATLAVVLTLEGCLNLYPPTSTASMAVTLCHLITLIGAFSRIVVLTPDTKTKIC